MGGALCIEVIGQKAMHFPDYERLLQAVRIANPDIETGWMKDEEYDRFRSKLNEVQEKNDAGDFNAAWQALKELLDWPPSEMPDFSEEAD